MSESPQPAVKPELSEGAAAPAGGISYPPAAFLAQQERIVRLEKALRPFAFEDHFIHRSQTAAPGHNDLKDVLEARAALGLPLRGSKETPQ